MDTLNAPAPWQLEGRGYISLLRFDDVAAQEAFIPDSLRGRRASSRYAWMMFVDYSHSNVGAYHELLFIPGKFAFADRQWHLSISRIFVSSMDSVVNGQRNWGIPKELAQFDVHYGSDGIDTVRVVQDGTPIADLRYRHVPIPLPFTTAILPQSVCTLGQHHQGRTFIYTPRARGWTRPATLLDATSNPAMFPDLSRMHSPFSVKVNEFAMTFPVSRVIDGL